MNNETPITPEEIHAICMDAMEDKAVTNISGWTEPNSDEPCDETAYRQRLGANAPDYMAKVREALSFE